MAAKRTRVTADEVKQTVMKALLAFEDRTLDIATIQRGLEMAASELVFIHLKAVAAAPRRGA